MTNEEREDHARQQGRAWAGTVRRSIEESGRRIEGGWPGTLTEARARLELPSSAAVAPAQIAHLARVLYGAARESWLSGASAE